MLENFEFGKMWDYENGFYLTSSPTRISKLIAHWELYKRIVNLPGEIVECGVYKGASSIRFATFRDIIECQNSRKIIGFDAFGAFPDSSLDTDKEFIHRFEVAGGDGISCEELQEVFKYKGFSNYELVKGNILETVPEYLTMHPQLKIALLHINVDVYDPTKVIIENLFNRVVRGGLIVLDDYSTVDGETRAIDEWLSITPEAKIEKLPYYKIPSYIVMK